MKMRSYLQSHLLLIAILSLFTSQPLSACTGTPCGAPCTKSVSVVKGVTSVILNRTLLAPQNTPIQVTVNTNSGTRPGCATCASPATVLGGTLTVVLTNVATGIPLPPVVVPIPPAPADNVSQNIPVAYLLPMGTPSGVYLVRATAVVNFSADSNGPPQTLSNAGDMLVCIVDPSPSDPSVPRLDMVSLNGAVTGCAPGTIVNNRYAVTNNDPVFPVTINATATSKQEADFPEVLGGDTSRAHAISSITGIGDDFPISWENDSIPNPLDPATYIQPPITQSGIVILPGETVILTLNAQSYGACKDGSCSQFIVEVNGTFSDGSTANACVSTGLVVADANCCDPLNNPPCGPGTTPVVITVDPGASLFPEDMAWQLINSQGCVVAGGECASFGPPTSEVLCLNDNETYHFIALDDYGDGWESGFYEIIRATDGCFLAGNNADDGVSGDFSTDCIGFDLESFASFTPQGPILGCTDPSSPNFDPCATVDDGSCITTACGPSTIPANLAVTVSPAFIGFTWDPVSGSVGCQLNGGPLGSFPGTQNILGFEPTSAGIPIAFVPPGVYNVRVRCACQLFPSIIATAYSNVEIFTVGASKAGNSTTTIYPNPARDQLTINYEAEASYRTDFEIYDVLGRTLWTQTETTTEGQNQLAVDVAGWDSGMYVLIQTNGGGRSVHWFEVMK